MRNEPEVIQFIQADTYNGDGFPDEPQTAFNTHVFAPTAGRPQPDHVLRPKKHHQHDLLPSRKKQLDLCMHICVSKHYPRGSGLVWINDTCEVHTDLQLLSDLSWSSDPERLTGLWGDAAGLTAVCLHKSKKCYNNYSLLAETYKAFSEKYPEGHFSAQ